MARLLARSWRAVKHADTWDLPRDTLLFPSRNTTKKQSFKSNDDTNQMSFSCFRYLFRGQRPFCFKKTFKSWPPSVLQQVAYFHFSIHFWKHFYLETFLTAKFIVQVILKSPDCSTVSKVFLEGRKGLFVCSKMSCTYHGVFPSNSCLTPIPSVWAMAHSLEWHLVVTGKDLDSSWNALANSQIML